MLSNIDVIYCNIKASDIKTKNRPAAGTFPTIHARFVVSFEKVNTTILERAFWSYFAEIIARHAIAVGRFKVFRSGREALISQLLRLSLSSRVIPFTMFRVTKHLRSRTVGESWNATIAQNKIEFAWHRSTFFESPNYYFFKIFFLIFIFLIYFLMETVTQFIDDIYMWHGHLIRSEEYLPYV